MSVILDQCPCAGETLDKLLQPAVLAILAGQSSPHGYRIVQRLSGLRICRGVKPDATGVYRALKAMQDRGLVTASWEAPESGPARRMFELTAAGRRCLGRWVATLEDYRRGIAELLDMLYEAAGAPPSRRRGKTARK